MADGANFSRVVWNIHVDHTCSCGRSRGLTRAYVGVLSPPPKTNIITFHFQKLLRFDEKKFTIKDSVDGFWTEILGVENGIFNPQIIFQNWEICRALIDKFGDTASHIFCHTLALKLDCKERRKKTKYRLESTLSKLEKPIGTCAIMPWCQSSNLEESLDTLFDC